MNIIPKCDIDFTQTFNNQELYIVNYILDTIYLFRHLCIYLAVLANK